MKRVIVESPYAGNAERNLRYLRACMHDCLMRGEAPFASHGLYTQPGVLDDDKPDERERGIQAGFAWREAADKTVVYVDLGISWGMQCGIDDAHAKSRPVEERRLVGWEVGASAAPTREDQLLDALSRLVAGRKSIEFSTPDEQAAWRNARRLLEELGAEAETSAERNSR